MQKPIIVNLNFDIQTIRKAVVLITGEMVTDEQIDEWFLNKPVSISESDADDPAEALQICIALLTLIIMERNKS